MASQVDIYNLALGNIGQSDTVASLEERSKARLVCSRYWDMARDALLADFEWPFATKYATLALMPVDTVNWLYTYQYPTDCLRAMYLTYPGNRRPDEKVQPQFKVAYGDGGQVILADVDAAQLAYIVRVEDTGRFPALFVEALAWKLASLIAMSITNTRTVAETAAQMYEGAKQVAWAAALNEEDQPTTFRSEYETARGTEGPDGYWGGRR